MIHSRFTLRSHADLIATFRPEDQKSVVIPKGTPYPFPVEHYFAWNDPSGVYAYMVFKRQDWETPRGLVLQRNGTGTAMSPAGQCDWCHSTGPSDEIGLLTTHMTSHSSGGSWLCLDLSCIQRIEERTGLAGKTSEKLIQKLCQRIGLFYERARIE